MTTWYAPLKIRLLAGWLRLIAKCRRQIKRECGVDSRRVDNRLWGTSLGISILSVCSHQKTICHVKLIASLLFYMFTKNKIKKRLQKQTFRHCSVKSVVGGLGNMMIINKTRRYHKEIPLLKTYKSDSCLGRQMVERIRKQRIVWRAGMCLMILWWSH